MSCYKWDIKCCPIRPVVNGPLQRSFFCQLGSSFKGFFGRVRKCWRGESYCCASALYRTSARMYDTIGCVVGLYARTIPVYNLPNSVYWVHTRTGWGLRLAVGVVTWIASAASASHPSLSGLSEAAEVVPDSARSPYVLVVGSHVCVASHRPPPSCAPLHAYVHGLGPSPATRSLTASVP
jgi:hypothetical protein